MSFLRGSCFRSLASRLFLLNPISLLRGGLLLLKCFLLSFLLLLVLALLFLELALLFSGAGRSLRGGLLRGGLLRGPLCLLLSSLRFGLPLLLLLLPLLFFAWAFVASSAKPR